MFKNLRDGQTRRVDIIVTDAVLSQMGGTCNVYGKTLKLRLNY